MEDEPLDPLKGLSAESLALYEQMPEREQRILHKLIFVHGPMSIKLRDGKHLFVNMACPECLEVSRTEFYSRHLGIDIGREYIGKRKRFCGRCNKQHKGFDIEALMAMPTLEQRGIKRPLSRLHIVEADNGLSQDDDGNKVPKAPGKAIPVTLLPDDHVAVQYLNNRGYTDMQRLYEQFQASYCISELPDQFYGREAHGFAKTPQGRLVFFLTTDGINRGWQARILESATDTHKFYYHPYTFEWFPYAQKTEKGWEPLPGCEKFKPAKYIIGVGTRSTQTLMGYDAAVAHEGDSLIITEGVLDAARIGPPAISVQGKGMSDRQIHMVADYLNPSGDRKFKRIVVVADNDKAGDMLKERVICAFESLVIEVEALTPPDPYKDLGEMPEDEARELVKDYI